jgi:putative endonuclease
MVRDAMLRIAPHHEGWRREGIAPQRRGLYFLLPAAISAFILRRRASAVSKDGPRMPDGAYVYIVRCADGSYYTGTARQGLELRLAEHNAGAYDGWTARRRPVILVFSEWFDRILDAIAAERQIKGWSRAKKEALIRGDFGALRDLSRRGSHPSRRDASS